MENGCTSPRETVAGRERCCADEKGCAQSFKSKSFKLHHSPPETSGTCTVGVGVHGGLDGPDVQWMM